MRLKTFDLLDKELTREESEFLALKDQYRHNYAEVPFKLDPTYWKKYYSEINRYTYNWNEHKYSVKPDFNKLIPTTDIGIYMFIIKAPDLVSMLPQFVLYVGISGETGSGRALRDRLKDYYSISSIKKRKKIHRLLCQYYGHTYIKYSLLPNISSNDLEKLEKDFHGFFYPPAGGRDYPVDMKQIKNAQWTK